MGHVLLATTLTGLLSYYFSLLVTVVLVTFGVFCWEYYQLDKRGATYKDYLEDTLFWFGGIWYGDYIYQIYDIPVWLFLPFILTFVLVYRVGGGKLW